MGFGFPSYDGGGVVQPVLDGFLVLPLYGRESFDRGGVRLTAVNYPTVIGLANFDCACSARHDRLLALAEGTGKGANDADKGSLLRLVLTVVSGERSVAGSDIVDPLDTLVELPDAGGDTV
jgi:hypothetical protein